MPQCYQRPRAAERTGGTWRMIARCIACRGKPADDGRRHVFQSSMWLPTAPRAAEYSQTVRSAQSRFAGSQGHFTLRNRFARANPGPVEPGRGRSWGTAPPTAASVLGTRASRPQMGQQDRRRSMRARRPRSQERRPARSAPRHSPFASRGGARAFGGRAVPGRGRPASCPTGLLSWPWPVGRGCLAGLSPARTPPRPGRLRVHRGASLRASRSASL